MKTVIDCLLTLRAQYKPTITTKSKSGSPRGNGSPRGQYSESKLQRTMRSPIMSGKIVLSLSLFPLCMCNYVYISFKISQLSSFSLDAYKILNMNKSQGDLMLCEH